MDKKTAILILKECFEVEGNCAFIHFVDGSDILIQNKPNYFGTSMSVESEYKYGEEIVKDVCFIPYSSILYIIVTNIENLRIATEYNANMQIEDVDMDILD